MLASKTIGLALGGHGSAPGGSCSTSRRVLGPPAVAKRSSSGASPSRASKTRDATHCRGGDEQRFTLASMSAPTSALNSASVSLASTAVSLVCLESTSGSGSSPSCSSAIVSSPTSMSPEPSASNIANAALTFSATAGGPPLPFLASAADDDAGCTMLSRRSIRSMIELGSISSPPRRSRAVRPRHCRTKQCTSTGARAISAVTDERRRSRCTPLPSPTEPRRPPSSPSEPLCEPERWRLGRRLPELDVRPAAERRSSPVEMVRCGLALGSKPNSSTKRGLPSSSRRDASSRLAALAISPLHSADLPPAARSMRRRTTASCSASVVATLPPSGRRHVGQFSK